MKKNKNFHKLKHFPIICILASSILLLFLFIFINNNSYNSLMNNFYSKFNSSEFEDAKELIKANNIVTLTNNKKINKDLKKYFTSIVNILCSNIKLGSITTDNALSVLKEIHSYEILNSSLDKLILTLEPSYNPNTEYSYSEFIELGNKYCNKKDFTKALNILSKIPESNKTYYSKAKDIISKCQNSYKDTLFTEADSLVKQDYYTKAIELLTNANVDIIGENNPDIVNKINKIKILKEEYLASLDEDSTDTSSEISANITLANINSLNIESATNYLIYVNLAEQQVYIYNGYTNNWDLSNKYICSSGIEGEPTPTGIFTISTRGDWFFSKDYQQGGKYWVQFSGDYLFHSLPYNENQDQVLDYTLGKPASHGCIRLNTSDAKWLYDNVPDNTKVIIQ